MPATIRRIAHGLLVVAFFVAIAFPAVRWFCIGKVRPAAVDFAMLSTWASDFESSFPSRAGNAKKYRRLRQRLFGIVPQSVIVGRDDWLFYHSEMSADGDTMEDFRGRSHLTSSEASEWAEVFVARERDLSARGADYALVIVPNKENAYVEHLPLIEQRRHSPLRRMDDLLAACAQRRVHAIDLRPALAKAKAERLAYFRTDTHWTDHGMVAGYRAILAALARRLPTSAHDLSPLAEEEFTWQPRMHAGDLTSMAKMGSTGAKEAYDALTPARDGAARTADGDLLLRAERPLTHPSWNEAEPPVLVTGNPDRAGVAVVFHDSFMFRMAPLLSQHFRRVTYVRGLFDMRIVERERPDVVIHEAAERHLDRLPRSATD